MWTLPRPRRAALPALLAAGALAASGCTPASDAAPSAGTLRVYAAASLRESFTALAEDYERAHPGVAIELNLAGSSDLAAQIREGAPADVLATADEATMASLGDAAGEDPAVFATNTLTIITAPGNPHGITRLEDLARADLAVVLCAPQVPCGAASRRLEQDTGVALRPVSEESNVRGVVDKVRTGQADAGLVYVTDAAAAGDAVAAVPDDRAAGVRNRYPITALPDAPQAEHARGFVDFVCSPEGQAVLRDAGFGAP